MARFDFATNRWVEDDPAALRRAFEPPPPATEPRPGAWTRPAAKASLPVRIVRAGMVFSALAVVVLAILWPGILMIVALWVVFACVLAHAFMVEEKARPSDRALLEDPDDRNAFVVVVRISRDTIPSPEDADRGVAWLAEGKLFFSGRRTSFVLGGEDVLPRREWPVAYDALRREGVAIPLRTGPPPYVLEVQGLPRRNAVERARYERFDDELRRFRDRPPTSDGRGRQWPPFERWRPPPSAPCA